jgi:hypothetical protein
MQATAAAAAATAATAVDSMRFGRKVPWYSCVTYGLEEQMLWLVTHLCGSPFRTCADLMPSAAALHQLLAHLFHCEGCYCKLLKHRWREP